MNLHIMLDEKVITRTIEYFENALPHQNTFIVIKTDSNTTPKYINPNGQILHYVKYNSSDFWSVVGDVYVYDNVIIHQLTWCSVKFVNKISHPNITWIVWGADLYVSLLEHKGYKLYYNKTNINNIKATLSPPYRRALRKFKSRWMYYCTLKAIRKINNIASTEGDFQLLTSYYPMMREKSKIEFYYYPINDILSKEQLENVELGDNIIVGNSASEYANHEEVFTLLNTLNIQNRKIVVPLSYGNPAIKNYVKNIGLKLLGGAFEPIEHFLPLTEYNKLLTDAYTYIYGNYRQEAMGNIIVALYLGATVFLHPQNPLLYEFKKKGYVCFPTTELSMRINYRLTEKERLMNKSCIIKEYNKDRLYILIKKYFR